MNTCRKMLSLVAVFALVLLGVGCAPAAPPREKVRLVMGVPADVSTLDIHNEPNSNTSHLIQFSESLLRTDENLKIQPALATSWNMIDDTTWEFKLREGVKFHDGTPFTAEDVKWSYDRIMEAGAESGIRKIYVGWFKGVEIIDDYTVRLHFETPYPPALAQIASLPVIMSKAQFEKGGAEELGKKPVGTGPFKVANWTVNESLELEANPDYWGGRPVIDELVLRVIPDESTRIAEMLTGGVDALIDVPLARVSELENKPDITVTSKAGVLNFYVGFNTHESPFDNLKVRQAVAHAIDVETMVNTILGGYGEHANSLVQSTSCGWNPNLKPFEYDPDLSKQLLAEAGYPDGFETVVDAAPGVWPTTEETAEAIGGYLDAVGIKTEVKISEFGDYFERYRGTKLEGLFLWGNIAPELDADIHVHLNFHCPPDGRGLYWCSDETDELIDKTRGELDVDAREKMFSRIQEIFQEQVVAVPLWQYDHVGAINSRFAWEPRGDFYLYATDIKLAE